MYIFCLFDVYIIKKGGHDPSYEIAAKEVATEMSKRNISLLHGGGTFGYMGIIAREVQSNGGEVLGVCMIVFDHLCNSYYNLTYTFFFFSSLLLLGVIPSALRNVSASGTTIYFFCLFVKFLFIYFFNLFFCCSVDITIIFIITCITRYIFIF